jgi:hypothetical protein
MKGPGKYDRACTKARQDCGGRGAILIIFEGKHGSGFSVQLPGQVIMDIPHLLRKLADDIENDLKEGVGH